MKTLPHLIVLLFAFTACTNEDYFTPDELKAVSIYKVGDKFKMRSSNTSDTLIFEIKNKHIEKKKAKGNTKYEELNFDFDIIKNQVLLTQGRFWSVSHPFDIEENNIAYEFNLNNSHYFSAIDLNDAKNNIVINGGAYSNAYCDVAVCFSEELGFLKFVGDDTLTLIQ